LKSTISSYTSNGGQMIDKQVIYYTEYDVYGRSVNQNITTYGHDGVTITAYKEINNINFDIYGNAGISTILGYSDPSKSTPLSKQIVEYVSYDEHNNALIQNITSFGYDFTTVIDYKEIVNVYAGNSADIKGIWTYQGRVSSSTINTYSEEGGTFVEKQVVGYTGYDMWGNATSQNILRIGKDGSTVLDYKEIVNHYEDWTDSEGKVHIVNNLWKYEGRTADSSISTYTNAIDGVLVEFQFVEIRFRTHFFVKRNAVVRHNLICNIKFSGLVVANTS